MPIYYFDVFQEGSLAVDEEGTMCADLEQAKYEAKLSARDLAAAAIQTGTLQGETCVEVRDEAHNIVASLTIAEVLAHPNTPRYGMGCEKAQRNQTVSRNGALN